MTTATPGTEMSLHEMATTLGIGDVVRNTDVLEAYPSHSIEKGARFVVVRNDLAGHVPGAGILSLRLAPDDEGLMGQHGDISEWGNCHEVYDFSMREEEHADGVDPADRANPGNAWSTNFEPVVPAPDALPLPERVAAVFAAKLFEALDDADMVEVRVRNRAEADPRICHSHDFCDANMVMDAAFRAMGIETPVDALSAEGGEGARFHAADALWGEAWGLAKAKWFVSARKLPDPGDEPEATSPSP